MRLLHTMLRVSNLEKSIDFYTNILKMTLLRKKDYPTGKFTLAFLGYGPEETNAVLELTYNWTSTQYELGTAYGHIAIGVNNIHQICTEIKAKKGKVIREPGPMKDSTSILAFIEDPDGYKIELIERN